MIAVYKNYNVHASYNKISFGYDCVVPEFEQLYEEYVVLELEHGVQTQDFSMYEPVESNYDLNKQVSLFDSLVEQGYFFKHQKVLIHRPVVGVW